MFARTSIGGLLLEDVDGWTFVVQGGVIGGTFRDEPGVLQIAIVPSNTLPLPVTHDICLSRAADLAQAGRLRPSIWKRSESVTGPYGSAEFERGSDQVYVWYCCRAPGVIVGAYSCPTEQARSWANRGVRVQCRSMITTAVFDRRAWAPMMRSREWSMRCSRVTTRRPSPDKNTASNSRACSPSPFTSPNIPSSSPTIANGANRLSASSRQNSSRSG